MKIFMILFSILFFERGSSYIYSDCKNVTCLSNCCSYTSYNYISDKNCTSKDCSCQSSNVNCTKNITKGVQDCPYTYSNCCNYSRDLNFNDPECESFYCNQISKEFCSVENSTINHTNGTPVGFGLCSCASGCCFYNQSLDYYDTSCSSPYCNCSNPDNCNLTYSITKVGYSYCNTYKCDSGCCYFNHTIFHSDYECSSMFCTCVSFLSPCVEYYSKYMNYSDAWVLADKMTTETGEKWFVINYKLWKAIVGIGGGVAGGIFFFNLYLLYKRIHKSKDLSSPDTI